MTRSLSVVDDDHAGYDTTLAETHVGRRRVEAGRRGHDDGVSGVRREGQNTTILL